MFRSFCGRVWRGHLKGASAEASTRSKDLSRQYSSRLAPAPSTANSPSCATLGATHDRYAGTAAINVVNSAV